MVQTLLHSLRLAQLCVLQHLKGGYVAVLAHFFGSASVDYSTPTITIKNFSNFQWQNICKYDFFMEKSYPAYKLNPNSNPNAGAKILYKNRIMRQIKNYA